MAIEILDNFSYKGKKPLDYRQRQLTLADLKALPETALWDGIEAYCEATGKYYVYKSTNSADATLGKWRERPAGVQVGTAAGTAFDGAQGQALKRQVEGLTDDLSSIGALADPTVLPYLTSEPTAPAAIEPGVLEQSNSDGALNVYYIQPTKRFLIKTESGKYYKSWEALNYGSAKFASSAEYGKEDANGVAPSVNKIYYKIGSKAAFVWGGSDLSALGGAHLQLGTTSTTAFKGSDGAALQTKVNEMTADVSSLKSETLSLASEAADIKGIVFSGTAVSYAKGIAAEVSPLTVEANSAGVVVYNSRSQRFLFESTNGSYYTRWPGCETYGEPKDDGVACLPSKLYFRESDGALYFWNGAGFSFPNGAHLQLGTTDSTAFKGSEGAKLKTDLNALTERVDSMENNGGVDLSEYDQKILELQQALWPLDVALNLSASIVEVGQTLSVTATGTVKRQGSDVTSGSTMKLTFDGSTADFSGSKTLSVNKTSPVTLPVVLQATYQGMTKSATKNIQIVNASYFGAVAASVTTPTEAQVKALPKSLLASRGCTKTGIALDNQKTCYAYPASYGALTSIKDGNNFENISSYTKHDLTIGGIAYFVYVLNDAVTISNAKQVFA